MRLRLLQVTDLEKPCVWELEFSRAATGADVREQAAKFALAPAERIRLYWRGAEFADDIPLCTILLDMDCLVFTVELDSKASSPETGPIRICGLEALANIGPKALRNIRKIMFEAQAGFDAGFAPELSEAGSGGTYFLKNGSGKYVACFKPRDEEPAAENNPRGLHDHISGALRQGVRAGEAVQREVAAFITDVGGFSRVPETVLVKAKHSGFHYRDGQVHYKVGSFQHFVPADCIASDFSPNLFPPEEVHRVAILDIRLLNADRNDANLLVSRRPKPSSPGAMPAGIPRPESDVRKLRSLSCSMGPMDFEYFLTPIDHGYCLPDKLEVAWCDWCWLDWPQARIPFSPATLQWIEDYDVEQCVNTLRKDLNVRESCLQLMRIAVMVLKKGARAGLCLHDIASIIARQDVDQPSILETQVARAHELSRMMENNSRVKGVNYSAALNNVKSLPKSSRRAATLSSCNLPYPETDQSVHATILASCGKENISRLGLPRMSAPSVEALRKPQHKIPPVEIRAGNIDIEEKRPTIAESSKFEPSSKDNDLATRFFFEYIERLVDDVILCVHKQRRALTTFLDEKTLFRRTTSMYLTSPHRAPIRANYRGQGGKLEVTCKKLAEDAGEVRRPRCASDDSFFPPKQHLYEHNVSGTHRQNHPSQSINFLGSLLPTHPACDSDEGEDDHAGETQLILTNKSEGNLDNAVLNPFTDVNHDHFLHIETVASKHLLHIHPMTSSFHEARQFSKLSISSPSASSHAQSRSLSQKSRFPLCYLPLS